MPSNWEGIHNIKSYIDAPMHLLFLGVVKLINSRILDWAAVSKNETRLLNTFSSIIPSIYDLKLEWCKMFPLSQSDSFSGLVSKNWLAVYVDFQGGCTAGCHLLSPIKPWIFFLPLKVFTSGKELI